MKNSYKYFRNNECEYFPCHKADSYEDFNCMFCFCPLYHQKQTCGGNYYISDKGIKICTDCIKPHKPEFYDYAMERLKAELF